VRGAPGQFALVRPAGHLDERAQADDGLVPPQLTRRDRCPRRALVRTGEPAGQQPADCPDDRFLPARRAQRRLAQQQRGERDVVADALDVIGVLSTDLGALAGKLADLIVGRLWEQASAASRASKLTELLLRGRPLMMQGVVSTLADRLGAALADRAHTAQDGGSLQAALEKIRVRALTDSAGTIHWQET
jgi:hypothetical protein